MAEDISKNVVLVLLVLVVLVASFGTWAFLSSFEAQESGSVGGGSGEVQLKLANVPPSVGYVALNLVKNEEAS